jgi:C-terminal processing protease CtpA/Prc
LKPLDIIVAIDGLEVADETLRESVQRIRGPKDTVVELTVRRGINTINPDSDQKPEVLTIEVVRGEILYPSVIGEVRDID